LGSLQKARGVKLPSWWTGNWSNTAFFFLFGRLIAAASPLPFWKLIDMLLVLVMSINSWKQ
jgi:hypothetical protein